MPEPLTLSLIGELLTKLHAAHPRNLGKQNPAMMAEVYRNGLRGLSGDAVRFAVDRSIQEDEYFPKVARLRELAAEWQKRNQATAVIKPAAGANEKYCPTCGAEAVWDGKRLSILHDARKHGVFVSSVEDT